MTEKKQLPDFWFFGGVELALRGDKSGACAEKVPKVSALEDQEWATSDILIGNREAKWKSRLTRTNAGYRARRSVPTLDERRKMKALFSVLLAIALGAPAIRAEESRPLPTDIRDFVADPIPYAPSDYFKNFKVTQKDFEIILKDYFQVGEEHWKHGYSHVAFGDRTGHLILKDGRKVKWMVKPGGLAWLEFRGGKKMYLAAEKTKWPLDK